MRPTLLRICPCILLCTLPAPAHAQSNFHGEYNFQVSYDDGESWQGPTNLRFELPMLTDVRMRLTATVYNPTSLGILGYTGQVRFTRSFGHALDFQVTNPSLVAPFNSISQSLSVSPPDSNSTFEIVRAPSTFQDFDAWQHTLGSPDFTPALTVPLVEWTLHTSDRLFMSYFVRAEGLGGGAPLLRYYNSSGQVVTGSMISLQPLLQIVPSPAPGTLLLLPLVAPRRRRVQPVPHQP